VSITRPATQSLEPFAVLVAGAYFEIILVRHVMTSAMQCCKLLLLLLLLQVA
jgi:hypothetical protein